MKENGSGEFKITVRSKIKTKMNFYVLATLVLTSLLTVMHCFVLKFGFDYRLGVYSATNSIGKVTAWGMFFSVLLLSSSLFTIGEKFDSRIKGLPVCSAQGAFFSLVSGGLVLAYSGITCVNGFLDTAQGNLLPTLILALSFPMSVYLVLTALAKNRNEKSLIALGFFPVIWVAACLLRIYFDRASAINNPVKILSQISLVAIMLYFLVELRFRIGKPKVKLYIASASVASLLGISYSTSVLLGEFLNTEKLGNEVMLSFTEFFISFYILMRLVNFVVSMKTQRAPVRGASQRFKLPDGKTCFKEQKSSDEGETL